MNKQMTVSDFINTKYREYWEYSNKNGKNAIVAKEQLPEVVRKIIYACYCLNVKEYDERKMLELKGEVAKIHAHGDSSIEESIKGVATAYKSTKPTRLLEGVGNFGAAPGDSGSAARYTSASGTPLLTAIYKDIPFMPMSTDDTGVSQPEYISTPIPLALIGGVSPIGTGKSCYLAERDAEEVINWIEELSQNDWDRIIKEPDPMSVTGCETKYNEDNGYIYYEALVHKNVDKHDISKKGRFDVITALPPKANAENVIYKLQEKLPTRAKNRIENGVGDGKPTWIIVPAGYLEEEDYAKYGMRTARKEQIFIWDDNHSSMRSGNLHDIAKEWFEDRCQVVIKRISKQIEDLERVNHRINLVRIYAENKMTDWKEEEIINFFVKEFPESGEEDAALVLRQPARAFLPANIDANEKTKKKNIKEIKDLKYKVDHIGSIVIQEAKEIIEKQNKFFED